MPGGIQLNPSASGSGDCCCGGGVTCIPCTIPPHDLTLSFPGSSFTNTLYYHPAVPNWTDTVGPPVPATYELDCLGGNTNFNINNTPLYTFTITSHVCSPYHIEGTWVNDDDGTTVLIVIDG
jgi:hypothetical protein